MSERLPSAPADDGSSAPLGPLDFLLLAVALVGAWLWWSAPPATSGAAWLVAKATPVTALWVLAFRRRRVSGGLLLLAALLAHLAGDLLLELAPFVAGMAAFGAGHVVLVVLFWRLRLDVDQIHGGTRFGLGALGLGAGAVLLGLGAHLHGLFAIAVPVYAALLATMAGTALLCRRGRPVLQAGAIAFVLSDALLALGRFGGVDLFSIGVWPLYVAAQTAIVLGGLGLAGREIAPRAEEADEGSIDSESG